MLILYTARNSICTQKVFVTLDEKQLEYETREIDLFRNQQYTPEYLRVNPKGVVPTLLHDSRPVFESTLICEYLDEVFPEPPLVPRDPWLKAQMRLWSKLIDEGLFEATREISFSAMFREKMKQMTPEQRETRFRNIGDPARRARYVSVFEQGHDSPYVYQAIAHYDKAFARMEQALAEGGPWLLGAEYSLADINLTPFVARLDYLNLLDLWAAQRPHARRWLQRAKERPSFRVIDDRLTKDEKDAMHRHGSAIREGVARKLAEYRSAAG
jgi:glutathione S-transferase